jgi:CheY-like chemotaxis protein
MALWITAIAMRYEHELCFHWNSKGIQMSDEARTVLIVTDDPSFSALISELMLRAGVQTIRFAQTQEALKLTRHLMPDLVLIHIARGSADAGHVCYETLQSDSALAHIPMLLYAPPIALSERAIGAPAMSVSADRHHLADRLVGQISPLLGIASPLRQHADHGSNEYAFPIGRDDL